MALQKEITLNNGIVTNYHTIQEVHYNFLENKTLIVLNSYVSKEIRDSHKKVDEVEQSILKLTNEAVKAEGKNDIDLLDSINEKINTLATTFQDISSKNYIAGISTITLNYIPEDITLTGLYKALKETKEYSKAKKV